MNRRDWLKFTPMAALPLLANRAFGQEAPRPFPGMTVRMQTPQNLEYPMTELKSFFTPTEQFYIRSHFATPKMEADFSLSVTGHVETPLKLTLADLKALGQVEMPLTLECAGNGRIFLVPQARGLQWANGAVGTATWGGVSLAAVLEKAKLKPGAIEVLLVGADSGAVTSDPPSPGVIPFDRSIPLAKAMKPETLLATHMNGEPLTASHGAPLRAVIGGWYGMAAVKWLKQIIVLDKPYNGFWQTLDYSYFERKNGLPSLTPVTAMLPKAVIARPAMSEVIPVGKPYKIAGAAWAGEEEIARVELSLDGGTAWADATLVGDKKPFCWRLWEFEWANPGPRGPVKLVAKATTTSGTTQPLTRDADRRTYMINHLVPTEVLVK